MPKSGHCPSQRARHELAQLKMVCVVNDFIFSEINDIALAGLLMG